MRVYREDTWRLAEQAAEWAATLDTAGAQEQAEFISWLRQSARNMEEFLLASAVYRELDGVDPQRREDIDSLLARAAPNVVTLNAAAKPRPRSHAVRTETACGNGRRALRWRLAAGLAIACAAGWLMSGSEGWRSYATDVGEQRAVELADGSLLHLNTASKVRVKLTADARDLQLVSGEALFRVAHDPARPFRVRSGETLIEALGTQFNVYRRADETRLSVLEGKVRVTQARQQDLLAAGEEVRIAGDGSIEALAAVDAVRALAWRQRRLVFRDDRLADVAAEFNRYNRAPQIRVEGAAAMERRLTGVFDADAPESLLRFLADAPELDVTHEEAAVVIRARSSARPLLRGRIYDQ
jgi:transmembrane sensor